MLRRARFGGTEQVAEIKRLDIRPSPRAPAPILRAVTRPLTGGGHPVAVTGYALMAFLAAGQLPDQGEYGKNVKRGIDFLLSQSRADGFISSADNISAGRQTSNMYDHGIASIALGEVYGTRRVLILSALGFAAVSFVKPFSPNLDVLLILQFAGGVASGFFVPLTIGFILRTMPPRRSGRNTLSAALAQGNSVASWNTKPISPGCG